MKLRTLSAAAALLIAGAMPAAYAQTTQATPQATGAGAGKFPKGEMAEEAMKKCNQEAAGVARESCLKRYQAEGGDPAMSKDKGMAKDKPMSGDTPAVEGGRKEGTRNSSTTEAPPKN